MANEKKVAVTEDDIIEYVLNALYTHLDKNELHLEKDILAPTKLELTEKQIEHIREMILATNFARNSVGFGKSSYLYLTPNGIQALKIYGSFKNYIAATQGTVEQNTVDTKPAADNTTKHNSQRNETTFEDDMAH